MREEKDRGCSEEGVRKGGGRAVQIEKFFQLISPFQVDFDSTAPVLVSSALYCMKKYITVVQLN